MTTPEQQAKMATPHATLIAQVLDSRMPRTEREHAAAREIEALAAERDTLKAELEALRGSAEPVAWLFKAHKPGYHLEVAALTEEGAGIWPLDQWKRVEKIALYTRPCVPLTDERIKAVIREASAGRALRPMGSEPTSVRIARAIEAEHKIGLPVDVANGEV
jgi:hypothetical protein